MKQKEMGIVRDIDNTGRIVIPKEIRRVLDLKARDSVEIIPQQTDSSFGSLIKSSWGNEVGE